MSVHRSATTLQVSVFNHRYYIPHGRYRIHDLICWMRYIGVDGIFTILTGALLLPTGYFPEGVDTSFQWYVHCSGDEVHILECYGHDGCGGNEGDDSDDDRDDDDDDRDDDDDECLPVALRCDGKLYTYFCDYTLHDSSRFSEMCIYIEYFPTYRLSTG